MDYVKFTLAVRIVSKTRSVPVASLQSRLALRGEGSGEVSR